MTWTKLSDDFADDCDQLSSDAFRLHVEGLIWSNRKLLDLYLDKNQMRRWVWNPDLAAVAVKELLAAGWWSDEGDHYLIRHHGRYQRTREQVLKQQAVNQRNGKKGGRPRGPGREQSTNYTRETESLTESLTERDGTGLDGTEAFKGSESYQAENGFNPARCRYCGTELAVPEQPRGYCGRATCKAEAEAELS